ncbi:MAG: asparaginase domain-containing protein [Firmicutes bacterium]|nr:asparaginase domain-containing protein [Bacillota bacterium]
MKILILATGGTISHDVGDDGVHRSNEKATKGDVFARLLERQAKALGGVQISSKTILNKDSGNMIMRDWEVISAAIAADYDAYDAFLVTHGTETMGYATSAMAFALGNLGKLVVFTGAQVAFGQVGSDALINLENALRFIVKGDAKQGVYLVFGSQIAAGVRAKKNSEFDYDAFYAPRHLPNLGIVGHSLKENKQAEDFYASHFRPSVWGVPKLDLKNKFESNIVVLSEFPGLHADVIINMAKSGVKGFILRSYGSGVPNVGPADAEFENLRPALEFLRARKIPVVITSQAANATANMDIYEPSFLARELGAIPARDMTIEATVAKLAWLLGCGHDYEEIAKLMPESLRGEIDAKI